MTGHVANRGSKAPQTATQATYSTEAAASKKRYTPGSAGAGCRAAQMVSAGRAVRADEAAPAAEGAVDAGGGEG